MAMDAPDLHGTLAQIVRADRGQLLAALIAVLRDFDLAEEALEDALESALIHWARAGVPQRPQGWLLTVARRKAIDRLRRARRFADRQADMTRLAQMDEADAAEASPEIPDERLRLIFTCCHPTLEPKSRVALTLRTVGGLSTAEIASAFLDQEATMGQRLSRAKAKIAASGIAFAIPGPEEWEGRLASVLTVIYLIFNEGYQASSGESPLRLGLCEEAIFLARMLDGLSPGQAETEGLLALMLLTHARRGARLDAAGEVTALADQEPELWDSAMIAEGLAVLDRAVARLAGGPYQIQAAISALHLQGVRNGATDWRQILLLYDGLWRLQPSPVVRLNRAVALAEAGGVEGALQELAALAEVLADYQPYHAALADLLARDGQGDAAAAAYDRAIALCSTPAQARFLQARRDRAKKDGAKKKAEHKLGQSPTGRS